MVKKILLSICLITVTVLSFSQIYVVKGKILDKETQEPVIGAVIHELYSTENGTSTDPEGNFSLSFEKSKVRIKVAYIGFKDTVLNLSLTNDTSLSVSLESLTNIEEVEIEDDEIFWSPENDSLKGEQKIIEAELIEQTSEITGEDLKNPILFNKTKPGSLNDEYILNRKGDAGELILIDGVRLYGSAMLFDFLPVVQDEALSGYRKYFGNFPAQFGGRSSSLTDIYIKEGNKSYYEGSINFDLLKTGFTLEGPVINNTSSLFVVSRISYLNNPYTDLLRTDISSSNQYWAHPGFYDLHIKYSHDISEKDKLNVTWFSNKNSLKAITNHVTDTSTYEREVKSAYSNQLATLSWRHIYSPYFSGDISVNYGRYNNVNNISGESLSLIQNEPGSVNEYDANYKSSNSALSLKTDFNYRFSTDHKLNFGAQIFHYRFQPVKAELLLHVYEQNFSVDTAWSGTPQNAQEFNLYVDDQIMLNDKLFIQGGLHFSSFTHENNNYYSVQPRVFVDYKLFEGVSVHASYSHYKQYIHYLSDHSVGLNADIFYPSGNTVLPQTSHKITGGLNMTLPYDIHMLADVYYERMSNTLEYKYNYGFFNDPESNLLPGTELSDRIIQGRSDAYGLRVILNKEINNFKFQAAHILSNYDMNFSDMVPEQKFQYKYNRRFDFKFKLTYSVNDDFSIHAQYIFKSGNYVTINKQAYIPFDAETVSLGTPVGSGDTYSWNGDLIENTGNINDFRLPSYARLDIGAYYKINDHMIGIKIYNFLNKKNTDFVDYQTTGLSNSSNGQLVKYGILPFFPTISYSYKFK